MSFTKTSVFSEVIHNPNDFYKKKKTVCDSVNELYNLSESLYVKLSIKKRKELDNKYGKINKMKCGQNSVSELILKNMFGSLELAKSINSENEYAIKLFNRYLDMLGDKITTPIINKQPVKDDVILDINNIIDTNCVEENIYNILNKDSFVFLTNPVNDHRIFKNEFKNNLVGGGKVFETKMNVDDVLMNKKEIRNQNTHREIFEKTLLNDLTDLVCKDKVFNDMNTLYSSRFQYLINTMFNCFINKYIVMNNLDVLDMVFLYKGETTIKLLFDKYKNVLEEMKLNDFIRMIQDTFKRSESKYVIYINNKLPNYTTHYLNINKLSCYLLQLCRDTIMKHKFDILPLNNITTNDLKEVVDKLNEKINLKHVNMVNIEKILGISLDNTSYVSDDNILIQPSKRNDSITTWNDNNEPLVGRINKNNVNNLYITMNETHEYNLGSPSPETVDTMDSYMLQRMKVNFIVYYLENNNVKMIECPSKLIDISIPKHNSTELYFFSLHKELEVMDYVYNYNNMFIVKYKGLTNYGHIIDLLKMLFHSFKHPWDGSNIKKSQDKLLFFIIMDIIETYKDDYNKINNLIYLLSKLCDINIILNEDNIKEGLEELIKLTDNLSNRGLKRFINELNRLIPKLIIREDKIKYNDFMVGLSRTLKTVVLDSNPLPVVPLPPTPDVPLPPTQDVPQPPTPVVHLPPTPDVHKPTPDVPLPPTPVVPLPPTPDVPKPDSKLKPINIKLIRHAYSIANKYKADHKIETINDNSYRDASLDNIGIFDIMKKRKEIKQILGNPDIIFCSPLLRTIQTMLYVFGNEDLEKRTIVPKIYILPVVTELDVKDIENKGSPDNITKEKIKHHKNNQLINYDKSPEALFYYNFGWKKNGVSKWYDLEGDVLRNINNERFKEFFNLLNSGHLNGMNVVMFTHWGFIMEIFRVITNGEKYSINNLDSIEFTYDPNNNTFSNIKKNVISS
jgi:broad specificity phosphatase PhoE